MRQRTEALRRLVLLLPCRPELDGPALDLEAMASQLEDDARGVVARVDGRLCGPERQEALASLVGDTGAQALVVCGPGPRRHGAAWHRAAREAGVPGDRVELVPLWDQCLPVVEDPAAAMRRARIMVEAALARVELGRDRALRTVEAVTSVLVIGGGVAGMQAAVDLGELGHQVFLVERTADLGGRAHRLSRTYPTQECKPDGCCPQSCRDCIFTPDPLVVTSHPNIQVLKPARIVDVSGGYGGYRATVRPTGGEAGGGEGPGGDASPEERVLEVGAIVVATGTVTFDPAEIPQLSPWHPDVITSVELEELLDRQRREGGPGPVRRPSDGRVPGRVHLIQCVGARDESHGSPDCSIVCCTYAIGQATELKRTLPAGSRVAVHYMDLRGPYRGFERHYHEALEEGVLFVRGRPASVEPAGDHLVVEGEDMDQGEPTEWDADLVVLSVGQLPPPGTEELAGMLGAIVDEDGYLLEPNPVWGVLERRGVYVVGCAAGPRGIRYSVRDAREAALGIHLALERAVVELSENLAEVDEGRCTGCGQCVEVCEYDAIALEERRDPKTGRRHQVAVVDLRRCRGCGNCATTCPSSAVSLTGWTDGQLVGEIERAAGGGG